MCRCLYYFVVVRFFGVVMVKFVGIGEGMNFFLFYCVMYRGVLKLLVIFILILFVIFFRKLIVIRCLVVLL